MTELRTLGRVEKDSAKSCRAGYYRHKVTVKAKSREQIGCTGSPRYASISKALSRVRKQALN
jgi:hypothetical protein